MQPKDRRLVTEKNLEDHTRSELAPVEATAQKAHDSSTEAISVAQSAHHKSDNAVTRVEHIETLAGLAPGDVTDATTANLMQQPDSSTRAALGGAIAAEIGTEGSTARQALESEGVRAMAQAMGAVFVYSENEPEETTKYGVPVIWIGPEPNYVPEVSIVDTSVRHLEVGVSFTGYDPDDDPITFVVDWGDGNQTANAVSPATHTYAQEGLYTISVTVDDGRATNTETTTIYAASPASNAWGIDTFSYPDGTILAGWVTNTEPEPAVRLETGSLFWGPIDQTVGGGRADTKAEVRNGKFSANANDPLSRSKATVANLPASSYRVSFHYNVTPGEAANQVSLFLACSPTTSRLDSGTTSYLIRLQRSGWVEFYNQNDGTLTNTSEQYALSELTGHLEVAYEAETGTVTLFHNGEEFAERVYAGPAYPKVGIDVQGSATIDNFEVGPL